MASRHGLKGFLKRLHLTQQECAVGAGVDQATISRIVSGKANPSSETLSRVKRWADRQAEKRGIPLHQRLTWDDLLRARRQTSNGSDGDDAGAAA